MSIVIRNMEFTYPGDNGYVCKVPDLTLARGKSYLLLGPSGSGKSTLLNLLAGILRPNRGELTVAGQDLSALSSIHMDRFRGEHIGFIFQTLNLIPWLNVRENIALGLAFAPKRRARLSDTVDARAEALAYRMNIDRKLMTSKAGKLSIGQQQRVAAARALIGAPDIVLADEPSSALDDANTQAFFDLLMSGLDQSRQTLLVVSHDTALAEFFDHVLSAEEIFKLDGQHV